MTSEMETKEFRYRLKFIIPDGYPNVIQFMATDKLNENDGYNAAFILEHLMINDLPLLLKNMNSCLYEVIHRIIRDDKWEFIK